MKVKFEKSCSTMVALILGMLIISSGVFADDEVVKPNPKDKDTFAKIRFKKTTEDKFRFLFTPSFAIAVTSFDTKAGESRAEKINDNLDDVVIGRHAEAAPLILINRRTRFQEMQSLLPSTVKGDLHGIYAGDVDQDGYRDLIIAGGGGEGITSGRDNVYLHNTGKDRRNLTFTDESSFVDLGSSQVRARHFLPFVDGVDPRVKYYLMAKPLEGYPNQVFTTDEDGRLYPLEDHSLNIPLDSEAKGDSFVDFDGDNDLDYCVNDGDQIRLFRNDGGVYTEMQREEIKFMGGVHGFKNLLDIGKITSVKWGDINNDGTMDLYIGRRMDYLKGDQYAFGEEDGRKLIQFCLLHQNDSDEFDEIVFKLKDSKININFVRRPGIGENSPKDIFIGKKNKNPKSRNALIDAKDAQGHVYEKPGIYIYHTGVTKGYYTWHLRWYADPESKDFLGRIYLNGDPEISENNIEHQDVDPVEDIVLINRGYKKGQLRLQRVPMDLEHIHIPRDAIWVDLNNDGNVDLAGIRGNFRGGENGDPFVYINEGSNSKKLPSFWKQPTTYLTADEDYLSQADCIAYGFLDNDGLPDTIVTNGYGLNPGNRGPIEFFYNVTEIENNWTIVVIKGRKPNLEGIGTHVRLMNKAGEYISGRRQVGANYNRIQSSNKLHFGLGSFRGIIKAEITWPDGSKEIKKIKPRMVNFIKWKK